MHEQLTGFAQLGSDVDQEASQLPKIFMGVALLGSSAFEY